MTITTLVALLFASCTKWMYGYVLFPEPGRPSAVGLAKVEADQAWFDGRDLTFRLLIGAVDGGVLLDRRFIPNYTVEVKDVRDCDAGERLDYIYADYFPESPSPSSMMELRPGEWFGGYERFPLDAQYEDGGTPDCIDATFTFHFAMAVDPHVTFHVKGEHVHQQADAGVR